MVDVALPVIRADRIEPLLLGGRAKSHDGDDLRLTASEDRGAVSTWKVAGLDPNRSNLVGPPAVRPRAILEDAAANLFLKDRFERIDDVF